MKKTTIKDVAKVAGVSYSTVSRSLNDSPLIPMKTKEHVKLVAAEMGFVFNENARSLITKRSHVILIVLPEHFESITVNVYHSRLVNTVREELEKHGLDLMLVLQTNRSEHTNNVLRLASQEKIDGVFFLDENPKEETIDMLRKIEMPVVFAHYPPSELISGFDCIYSDNRKGGSLAAEYLLSKGYRDFLVLASNEYHQEFELRKEGFLDAIRKAGCEAKLLSTLTDFYETKELVGDNLSLFHKGQAVFAINDQMALGVLSELGMKGYRFPQDIAIMGYDDSEFCEYSNPPLSTIHQAREDIAFVACQRLLAQMTEDCQESVIQQGIAPSLVIRSTT